MKNYSLTDVLGLVVVVTMMGCGGGAAKSGAGGSSGTVSGCGQVEPCGGSVVGKWKVSGSCFNGALLTGSCPQAIYDGSGLTVAGSATYGADMSYSSVATISGTSVITLPPSCLTMNGITLTCAQLNQAIQADMASNPDPSVQSYSCADAATGCRCTEVSAPMNTNEAGTYTISGNQITTTPNDGTGPSTDDYCVQGTALHFVSVADAMNMGPMGMATITSDIVLTRQ